MSFQSDALYELLIELSKIKDLKATSYSSVKGGIITGVATTIGGLLLGKHGLMLGAAIGGITCATLADEFKPVWIILRDLSYEKKEKLLSNVSKAISDIGFKNLALVGTLLLSNERLKDAAIKQIGIFLKEQYNLRLM